MSQKVWMPEIELLERTPNQASFELSFPKDLEIFEGHFPDFSITPGLVQTHLIVQLASEYFSVDPYPTEIPTIKFSKPITPEQKVNLNIEFEESTRTLKFAYKSGGDLCSKGSLRVEKLQRTYSFVIPSYQHAYALEGILQSLAPFGYPCVVVNDASDAENTARLREVCAEHSWVYLVEHKVNQGKGGAVISGLKKAGELGCTHSIQIDSDGQHDIDKVQALIELSKKNPKDVVSGRPVYDDTVPTGRKIGRYITHFWVWVETLSLEIEDSMCGFRVYPLSSTLKMLERSSIGLRMDFDIEVLVRLYWAGLSVQYLPVQVIYPEDGVSHFRMFKDNVSISWMHTKLFFGMLPRMPKLLYRKLVKKKEVSHWSKVDEKGMVLGIKTLLFIYTLLGRKVLDFFLRIVVFYYSLVARSAQRASLDYRQKYKAYCQKQNIEYKPFSFFAHVYTFADSMFDKLAVWKGEYNRSMIHSEDLKVFDELKATSGGGVMISGHFGNIEIARALGRTTHKKYVALVYTENAVKFNSCLEEINGESTLNMLSVKTVTPALAIELQERVDRGEWVVIMGDRGSISGAGRRIDVEVLGEQAQLPEGPFLLAYLLNVPVYAFFCYKEGQHMRIKTADITPKSDGAKTPRKKFVDEVARNYANQLTANIVAAPKQWFNFFKFWEKYE